MKSVSGLLYLDSRFIYKRFFDNSLKINDVIDAEYELNIGIAIGI